MYFQNFLSKCFKAVLTLKSNISVAINNKLSINILKVAANKKLNMILLHNFHAFLF